MRRLVAAAVIAALALVTVPGVLQAQRRADLAGLRAELDQLKKELDELAELAVQVPTAAEAVQELSERLAVLEQDIDQLRRQRAAMPQAVEVIDELTVRTDALEEEMSTLRTRLADLEQPWTPAGEPGAGGGLTYDGGFRLQSPGGRYALTLFGYAQARYRLELLDAGEGVADDTIDVSTFALRRARLGAHGHLGSDRLRFALLAELVRERPLLDAFGDVRLARGLWLRFGQTKVPFTRSFITNAPVLAFVERSAVVDAFRYGRDPGAWVHGSVASDRLHYAAGLSNGAGPSRLDDNIDFLITARLEAAVVGAHIDHRYVDLERSAKPRLTVGAGVAHDLTSVPAAIGGVEVQDPDVDDDGTVDNIRVVSASADAVFRFRGFEAAVEGLYRREDWGTILDGNPDWVAAIGSGGATRSFWGAYAQATYLVVPEVAVGARLGRTQLPFLGLGGRPGLHPDDDDLWQLDVLGQLYRNGARFVSLQYTLTAVDTREPAADRTGHALVAEGQLVF